MITVNSIAEYEAKREKLFARFHSILSMEKEAGIARGGYIPASQKGEEAYQQIGELDRFVLWENTRMPIEEYAEASRILLPDSYIYVPGETARKELSAGGIPVGPQLRLDGEFVSFTPTVKGGYTFGYSAMDIEEDARTKVITTGHRRKFLGQDMEDFEKGSPLYYLSSTSVSLLFKENPEWAAGLFTAKERKPMSAFPEIGDIIQAEFPRIEQSLGNLRRLHRCTVAIVDARLKNASENGHVTDTWMENL